MFDLKLKKPKFWDNKNLSFFSIILSPLSLLTIIVNFIKKFQNKKNYSIKTICIGNIYIGGTGKTPLAIKINDKFKNKFKTVFIKKNYLNQIDEQKLLKSNGSLIVSNKRHIALKKAIKEKYDLAIIDDGLQEKGIKYADLLEKEILNQGPDSVLAFIFEPIGGASTGALVPPDSYFQ